MTYLWIPAIPIWVVLHEASPVRFQWREQGHRVVMLAEQWRVDVEWWRTRVWRDYYRLVTHEGYLVVIYQDLLTTEWYLQQLYD